MVRLKRGKRNGIQMFLLRFNSTMVRLKPAKALGMSEKEYVSIPQWFD